MHNDLINYLKAERLIKWLEFTSTYDNTVLEELDELKENRAKLHEVVESFSDSRREILKGKYFEGKTLVEIAIDTQYSYAHIKMIHTQTMKILKDLEPYIKY